MLGKILVTGVAGVVLAGAGVSLEYTQRNADQNLIDRCVAVEVMQQEGVANNSFYLKQKAIALEDELWTELREDRNAEQPIYTTKARNEARSILNANSVQGTEKSYGHKKL